MKPILFFQPMISEDSAHIKPTLGQVSSINSSFLNSSTFDVSCAQLFLLKPKFRRTKIDNNNCGNLQQQLCEGRSHILKPENCENAENLYTFIMPQLFQREIRSTKKKETEHNK